MAAVEVANLVARLSADTGDFDRDMRKSETRMSKVGSVAKVGLAVGVGAAVVVLKSSVSAALDAEKAEARLEQAFRTTHATAVQRAKAQEAVNRVSKSAALDDEDLSDSLAKLLRATGSVTKAQQGMALAADIARARHISLEQATRTVERAMLGNETALKRVGVQIDKNDTTQEALAKAQTKFAGAAEAYGKTTSGAQDRFRVAVENLQESIGKKLLPILGDLIQYATKLTEWLSEHPRLAKALAVAIGVLAGALVAAKVAMVLMNLAFLASPIGLIVIGVAALAAGLVVAYQRSETFRGIVKGVMEVVRVAIDNVKVAVDHVITVVRWLADHADEAWAVAKWAPPIVTIRIFKEVIDNLIGLAQWLIGHAADIWAIARWAPPIVTIRVFKEVIEKLVDLGQWLVNHAGEIWDVAKWTPPVAAIRVLKNIIEDIVHGLRWIADHADLVMNIHIKFPDLPGKSGIDTAKDIFGKLTGDGMIDANIAYNPDLLAPQIPGVAGAQGLQPQILDELALATRFGLGLTSGYRAGSITSTGNTSLHASGRAIDVAGSPSQMAAYAAAVAGRSGVAEVIYSGPGGRGGWYPGVGWTTSIPSSVLNDHRNHVHVGVGDGLVGTGGGPGGTVVNVYGSLVHERDLIRYLRAVVRNGARDGITLNAPQPGF